MKKSGLLGVLICGLLFCGCGMVDPTGPSADVVTSETWKINDTESPENYADVVLSKLSDSTVRVSGKFIYDFWGYEITCKFLSGTASISDSNVTINVTGTASYPPDSSGSIESSSFNLLLNGIFRNGTSNGSWNITFSNADWQGWEPSGQFTGRLLTGTDITY